MAPRKEPPIVPRVARRELDRDQRPLTESNARRAVIKKHNTPPFESVSDRLQAAGPRNMGVRFKSADGVFMHPSRGGQLCLRDLEQTPCGGNMPRRDVKKVLTSC